VRRFDAGLNFFLYGVCRFSSRRAISANPQECDKENGLRRTESDVKPSHSKLLRYPEKLSQLLDRPVDQHADVALALAGDFGNLAIGKSFTPQIDSLTMRGWQSGNHPLQLVAVVLPQGLVGRIGLASDQIGQVAVSIARVPLSLADEVHCLVATDAEEPGGLAAAKFLRRLLAKLQEGVLHYLSGRIAVAQQSRGIADQRSLEAFEDR
jgi:hypothetical protein